MRDFDRWRIGLSASSLYYFKQLPIATPKSWIYTPFTEMVEDSLGGNATLGFINLVLHWDDLYRTELYWFLKFVTDARALSTPLLFMTINRAHGTSLGPDWVDLKGRPHYPEIRNGPGGILASVDFKLNAIELVNDPAVFS